MEEAVRRTLEESLEGEEYADLRGDRQAFLDALAYALNRLPPRYVVTERGGLYTRSEELRHQFRADILVEVTRALEVVRRNRR